MTTFTNLQTRVSRALGDPGSVTFAAQDTADLLNDAIAEVSRIAPKRFVETVTVTADTLSYSLAIGTSPEIEVKRVEVWDISVTPNKQTAWLNPASGEPQNNSQAGWEYFAGALRLPNAVETSLVVGQHQLRVYGYAPYQTVDLASAASTDPGMSNEIEKACILYCQVAGLRRLMSRRDLFTQWQGQANNSDVSPAALINSFAVASEEWRRLSRAISVLREGS